MVLGVRELIWTRSSRGHTEERTRARTCAGTRQLACLSTMCINTDHTAAERHRASHHPARSIWRGAMMAVQFGDARSRVPFASPRLTSLPRYRSQTSTRARETRITDRSHAGPLPFSQRAPCAPLTAQQLSTTYECEYPQADLMLPTRYQQIPQKPHGSSRRNWPIAEPCGSSLARFERHASITSHGF